SSLFALSPTHLVNFINVCHCFVIGANAANNFFIPVGAGKATFNSNSSPLPLTLTTVPAPHFLCDTRSPTCHDSFSAPVLIRSARRLLVRVPVISLLTPSIRERPSDPLRLAKLGA